MKKQPSIKLTPAQLKMKAVLKPIVEGILNEAAFASSPSGKAFFQELTQLVNKYESKGLNYNVIINMLSNFPDVKFV